MTVWVVESYLACTVPKVTKYELVKEGKSGITVKFRAATKRIPPASSRCWFTCRSQLHQYLHRWLKDRQDFLCNQLRAVDRIKLDLHDGAFEVHVVPPAVRSNCETRPEI